MKPYLRADYHPPAPLLAVAVAVAVQRMRGVGRGACAFM